MNATTISSLSLARLNRFVLAMALVWTVLIGSLLTWNHQSGRREMLAQARKEALGSIGKDLLYRSWIRKQGGVYVPVTDENQPSPYLAHVPERDITTPSGRRLTLMNSSYVGRQIQLLSKGHGDLVGHNTSLKPLHPDNVPDAWEEKALLALAGGEPEFASVENLGSEPHLRLIIPLKVEEQCLKCHGHQQYRVGDIRGGISVSVPLASYLATARSQMRDRLAGHGIIWLVGMAGLLFGRSRMRRGILETSAAEAALTKSEARNRAIVDAIPDVIFRMAEDGTFLDCHDSRRDFLPLPPEEIVGMKAADVLPAALAEEVEGNLARAIASGEVQVFHCQLAMADRQRFYEGRMVATGRGEVLAIFHDSTERTRAEQERLDLERQLLHSQKLESIGVLAGGIAHDFNNLLAIIQGNLELALRGIGPPERISCALKAVRRSAELTGQMLAYTGKGTFIVSRVDLGTLVEENIHLLNASMPKNVSLSLHLQRPITPISADPGKLHQVIMNLVTNAWESCGEQPGEITVSTGEGEFDSRYLGRSRLQEVPAAGRYVYLQVDDTGCGMDSETQRCLFDPFFTTKFTGRGLGMSAILGIVRSHRGAIIVDSEPGRGSVIRVLFPVPEEQAEAAVLEERGPFAAPAAPPLGKTVLVVDDEALLRDICKEMVESLGYVVITAADGVEAVELFRQHVREIDCVLLDLSMPRMDGLSAFREMVKVRADVPVILTSGYHEEDVAGRFADEGAVGFIQKPYDLNKLQQALSWVFGGQAA